MTKPPMIVSGDEIVFNRKRRLGKSEAEKASLSLHPLAAERRLKRAVAWHKRVCDEEDTVGLCRAELAPDARHSAPFSKRLSARPHRASHRPIADHKAASSACWHGSPSTRRFR